MVLTRGLLQSDNDNLGLGDEISTAQITIHHNGTPLADGTDVIDIVVGAQFDPLFGVSGVWVDVVDKWNIHAVVPLTPGNHTFDVRVRDYMAGTGDPFYAGGAPVAPGPPPEAAAEGSLIVLVIY